VYVRTLDRKITKRRDELVRVESEATDDAEVVLLGYGLVGRAAQAVARAAREEDLRVGSVRPVTLWPFAGPEIQALCGGARRVIVMENNLGQMLPFVQAAAGGTADVIPMPPRVLGTLHRPADVLATIREVL
jgi:2-oxoglutarate ferredoxin oxidoreductase subunit alpha